MKEIPLSQGKVALVDDGDYEWLKQYKWSAVKGRRTFYAFRNAPRNGKPRETPIMMHREIKGIADSKIQVDHEDGNGLHNWQDNIRVATHSDNQCNQGVPENNTSGFLGVTWHVRRKAWMAQIQKDGRHLFLGYFNEKEDAAHRRDEKAIELHGKFAVLNFPIQKGENHERRTTITA